jgi:hypothetical protein
VFPWDSVTALLFWPAGKLTVAPVSVPAFPKPCQAPPVAKLWKYVLQLPTLARVIAWAGPAVAPVPTVMLPAVTANVTNSMVVGAFVPEGFVGRGDGAPAGAVRLVVTLTDVPLVTVVLLENVMLELHDPSAGKFTAVPATMVLAVPVPLAETVPHGNVSAGLLEVVGAAVGVLVADAATTVGALVLEQPETIAAETMNASVAPTKSGRLSDVFMKLGASKLPQRERRHPQNGGYLTTGFIFSVVPAFLVKSSQKRHLSGRVLSQVADADPNQAHGGSLYVRALQALLGRGEDRRRLVGRLGEMRLAARDLEVGALESPHATPRPRFNGAATISSRNRRSAWPPAS